MSKTPIESLLERCPSIYKLVVVAAKRAKELAEGAPKLIETDSKKVTTIALEEILSGKVSCKFDEAEEVDSESKTKKRRSEKKK